MRRAPDRDIPYRNERFRLGHRPALDGLRGIAIFSVLGAHVFGGMLGTTWFGNGAVGVDLFFVLSGFLITTLLVEELADTGRISLRAFYRRRAFRLFPALWLVLVAVLAFDAIVTRVSATYSIVGDLRGAMSIFVFIANWQQVYNWSPLPGLEQAWSLGIEEQFYVLFPLLLIGFATFRRGRFIVPGLIVGLVATITLRDLGWAQSSNQAITWLATYRRLDGLLLGALAAVMLHRGWRPARLIVTFGALAAPVLAWEIIKPPWVDTVAESPAIVVGFTLVLVAALEGGILATALSWPPLRWLGRISYSLYLWHPAVFYMLQQTWPAESVIRAVFGVVLSLAAAVISYYLIERPLIQWNRNRLGSFAAYGEAMPEAANCVPLLPGSHS